MKTPFLAPLFRRAFSISACALSLGAVSQLHSQIVITTASGGGSDAWAGRTASTTNYGSANTFQVRGSGSSDERYGYLRFDLGSNTAAEITSPSLTLVAANAITGASFTLWGLVNGTNADASSGGWSESGLTYANASGRNGNGTLATTSGAQAGTPTSYALQLGTFTLTATTGLSFTLGTGVTTSSVTQSSDLPANLTTFLQADTNGLVTLVFTSGTNSSSTFYTKEYVTTPSAPALSFNTAAVPEPSTYALLAGGAILGLTLVIRRRSKA